MDVVVHLGACADGEGPKVGGVGSGDGLRVAVLLPDEPSPDLKALLKAQGVHLVHRADGGFAGFPLAG
ncbi:hypothetical protein ABTY53_16875 [Streptomyces noursei]|uniref:hypothetical protein n=1 Tax=Streptomyces noursei TaxID=1971 RepID=UPI00331EDEA0